MTRILAIVAGVGLLAAALMGWLYTGSLKQNGKLQQALATATTRLTEINNVQKERDQVHGTNLALPDDKLFDGLLK